MPQQFTGRKKLAAEKKTFTAENAEIAEVFLFLVFSAHSARSAVKEFGCGKRVNP
jgi:hypothetical protein